MKFSTLILIGICSLALAVPALAQDVQDESGERSLENVIVQTLKTNPDLHAAKAEYNAVYETLDQALSGWRPTVNATADITSTEIDSKSGAGDNFQGDGSTSKNYGVALEQPIFRGGRTHAATKAAKATIAAQKASIQNTEQTVILSALTAYMNVVRDKSLLDLSQNNLEVIAKQNEATQERFEVGELTRTDTSQARARLAEAESGTISAKGTLETSKAEFTQITGLSSQSMPSIDAVKTDFGLSIPQSLDESLTLAEQGNLETLEASYAQEAAEKDVDGIWGEFLPEVKLAAGWNKSYDPSSFTDEQTTETIGLQATLPLYQAGNIRSRLRQSKHTANQRYLEILKARRNARQNTITAWQNWKSAQAEILSRKAQVEASSVALNGTQEEAEFGERTVLDVLDATQEYLDARVDLVTARRNETVAFFSLAAEMGLLTEKNLFDE
jgi:outer membrane protein